MVDHLDRDVRLRDLGRGAPTRVFVARDRLGIKPLYWLDDGRTLRLRLGDQGAAAAAAAPRGRPRRARALPDVRRRAAAAHAVRRRLASSRPAARCSIDRDGPAAAARATGTRWPNRADYDGDDRRLGGGAPLPARALDRPPDDERRARRRLPLGRRRLVDERRADEPARRPTRSTRSRSASTTPTQLQRVRLGAAGRRAVRHATTTRSRSATTTCGTSCPTSCTTRTSRSPIRSACRCYFVAKLAKEQRRHGRARRRGRRRAARGLPDLRAGASRWRTRHVAAAARRCRAPLRSGARGGGRHAARRSSRSARSTSRRCSARPQPDGRLWWGGAVAFYEHGLDRVTTPALRDRRSTATAPRDVVAGIARRRRSTAAPATSSTG